MESGLDAPLALLRALVYLGSVAAAGGVLFALSFGRAAEAVGPAVKRQIVFGCYLLLAVEPVRYVAFEYAVGQSDWSQAFSPDLRWMAFETPMGRALALRVVAAAALLAFGSRWRSVALAAAVAMMVSFLLEGHTASPETGSVLASVLLLLHLTAVHWWLGALYPLFVLMRRGASEYGLRVVDTFSRRAVGVVTVLVAAGAVLLGLLIDWQPRLASPYQQRFAFKLFLVAVLLAIAGWNKLGLTPAVEREPVSGSARLATSICYEIAVAAAILMATAWALTTGPDM